MYYPLLRGRQNELLAIKELLEAGKLHEKIIPIIEPVKLSPTLVNTVEAFYRAGHQCVVIRNPKVGSFYSDMSNTKNARYLERLLGVVNEDNSVCSGFILNSNTNDVITDWLSKKIPDRSIVALCLEPDKISYYTGAKIDETQIRTVTPYAPSFRQIRKNKILLEDKFNKMRRNADYANNEDEFFSNDYLFVIDEKAYVGFSDYSIIGEEYSETGFKPYAVAIHIVYLDSNDDLCVHHFVSDDKDDTADTAGKLYQALGKLVEWNGAKQLNTIGMKRFEEIYNTQSYPGLGIVKKLSIMHHMELVGQLFDRIGL